MCAERKSNRCRKSIGTILRTNPARPAMSEAAKTVASLEKLQVERDHWIAVAKTRQNEIERLMKFIAAKDLEIKRLQDELDCAKGAYE